MKTPWGGGTTKQEEVHPLVSDRRTSRLGISPISSFHRARAIYIQTFSAEDCVNDFSENENENGKTYLLKVCDDLNVRNMLRK